MEGILVNLLGPCPSAHLRTSIKCRHAHNYYYKYGNTENSVVAMQDHTQINYYTIMSQASAHVPHFKGPLQQLLYKLMEFLSWASAHVGQNWVMFKRPWALTRDTMVLWYIQLLASHPKLTSMLHFSINGSLAGNWASYEAIPWEYLGFTFTL